MHVDHLDERLRLSEELLALAARIGERELEALGHHWRIYDLLEAARVDDARDAHRALATLAAELRQPLYTISRPAGRSCGRRWRAASTTPSGSRARPTSSAARAQARDADTTRYRDLVERTGFVCALGQDLTREPVPGLRGADLAEDDPVRGEWDVVVVSPHFNVALLARNLVTPVPTWTGCSSTP